MYKILFDASPHTLSLRSTVRFATLLLRRGCQVFYTEPSDPSLVHDLITLGICVVAYPDDLRWFTPDLVLLDHHLKDRIPVYARYGIRHLFISTRRSMDEATLQTHGRTPLLCLPPLPERRRAHGARESEFITRMKQIKENPSRTIVISALEDGHPHIYKVIKHCALHQPQYHFVLLTNRGDISESLFTLPPNVSIYRPSDMPSLLSLCHLALVSDEAKTSAECTFRHKPSIHLPNHYQRIITPSQLEHHLEDLIRRQAYLTRQQLILAGFFLHASQRLDEWADWLITYLKQKANETTDFEAEICN